MSVQVIDDNTKIDSDFDIWVSNSSDPTVSQSSYLKPSNKPDLNNFTKYPRKVTIDWEIYGISGVVTLQGSYNLLYHRDTYYFLDRISSSRPDIHRYSLKRWFWVNDVIGAQSEIEGTLIKTTNTADFSHDYSLTTPTVSSGNSILYYEVVTQEERERNLDNLLQKPIEFLQNPNHYSLLWRNNPITIQNPNKEAGLPNFNRIDGYDVVRNWDLELACELVKWIDEKKDKLRVYDINKDIYSSLVKLLGAVEENENKVFVIADSGYSGPRHFAKQETLSKDFETIDLSGLRKIIPKSDRDLENEADSNVFENKPIEDHNVIKIQLSNVSFSNNTRKREIKYKGELQTEKTLGCLEGGCVQTKLFQVIKGYDKEGNPIKETLHDGNLENTYIDLDQYVFSINEEVIDNHEDLHDIKSLIAGELNKLDYGWSGRWIVYEERNNEQIPYYLEVIKVKLSDGWTINDKDYLSYLKVFNVTRTHVGISWVLKESEHIKDNDDIDFLQRIERVRQYPYDPGYYPPEMGMDKWKAKNKVKDIVKESSTDFKGEFTKKEIIQLIKDIALKSLDDPLVMRVVMGITADIPKDKTTIETSGSVYWDKLNTLSGTKIDEEEYVKLRKFNTDSDATRVIFQTNLADGDKEYKKGLSFPFLARKGQLETKWSNEHSIKNRSDSEKFINEWFVNWYDKNDELGDVYFVNKFEYGIYWESDDKKLYCLAITIFKKYKNKIYPFKLLLRPWDSEKLYLRRNENNPDVLKKQYRVRISFKQWAHRILQSNFSYLYQQANEEDYSLKNWLWILHVLDKQGDILRGSLNESRYLYQHSYGSIDSTNWNSWGGTNWSEGNDIPIYERVSNVKFHIKSFLDYFDPEKYRYTQHEQVFNVLKLYMQTDQTILARDDKVKSLKNTFQLFDLDGTNFYLWACQKQDKSWDFELLVKHNDETLKDVISLDNYKMAKAARALNDPIEIINSSLTLSVFGTTIPLKWRGPIENNWTPESFIVMPLERHGTNHNDDVLLVECKTSMDYIRDILKVMKSEEALTDKMSATDLSEARLKLKQEMFLNRNQLDIFNLSREKFFASLRSQKEDVDISKNALIWNSISSITKSAVSIGLDLVASPASGIATAISQTSGTVNDIWNNYNEYYKKRRNYEFNKVFGTREFDLRGDAQQATFTVLDIQKKAELYNLSTNTKLSDPGADSSLFKSLKTRMKMSNIRLEVLYPTGVMYQKLKKYYAAYGYDVQIPDHTISTTDLKKGDVYKFSSVEKITNITDPIIASYVKRIFLEGFRII